MIPLIAASTAGALIEYYDFYIFGALAILISSKFFPKEHPTVAFMATLSAFAAGMLVRPFGSLFFGRLGDITGRKYTFVVTLLLMGISTSAIGLVPAYKTIGFAAPLLVLILRLIQGLAIGGEFGGASTFVAEHCPVNKRGFWTSWTTMVAGGGFALACIVIVLTKSFLSPAAWDDWGWRLPFLLSSVLLILPIIIRKKISESPLFEQAKVAGKTSWNPIKDSFGKKENLKVVLLALFRLTLGIGVVGYSSTFFIQSFLVRFMFIDYNQANIIVISGITLGIPLYIFFGWLSDHIGRKTILMMTLLLGIVAFRPIFGCIYQTVNLQRKKELISAKNIQIKIQVPANGTPGNMVYIRHVYTDGTVYEEVQNRYDRVEKNEITKKIMLCSADKLKLIFWVFMLMVIVTASAGPAAAYLVEMFPLPIRFTSLSLPYHIGYGIFGGIAPVISTYLIAKSNQSHNPNFFLAGLNYPIIMMSVSLVIGVFYLQDRSVSLTFSSMTFRTNKIKKSLGLIWIALSFLTAYLCIIVFGIPNI